MPFSVIYAGLWGYLPGNPYTNSPIVVLPVYALFFLPFYAPGLAMVGLLWNGSRNPRFTRLQYYGLVVTLLVLQMLLTFIIPCPNVNDLCIPTPTTGVVALFLISRVVKEPVVAWSELEGNDQAFTPDAAAD